MLYITDHDKRIQTWCQNILNEIIHLKETAKFPLFYLNISNVYCHSYQQAVCIQDPSYNSCRHVNWFFFFAMFKVYH